MERLKWFLLGASWVGGSFFANRLYHRLVPRFLQRRLIAEELFACRLADVEPPPARDDVTVRWYRDLRALSAAERAFVWHETDRLARRAWQPCLRRGDCELALASLQGNAVHFTQSQYASGGAFHRYGLLMQPKAVYVGPCVTAAGARGRGLFPYLQRLALVRARDAGYEWAYISASFDNRASLQGIRKCGAWQYVGRVLLGRRPWRAHFELCAAVIENAEYVRTAGLVRPADAEDLSDYSEGAAPMRPLVVFGHAATATLPRRQDCSA